MTHHSLRDVEEYSKRTQRALKIFIGGGGGLETPKKAIWRPKSHFWRILGVFSPPPPPMKNLRARWALFEYSSAYFSEKIFTALDIYDSGLGMVRQKLLIWKKWNLLKSELKNFTHISDIHFWKFHGFKPMGVSCLNPSEMDILGLILDGNNRQLFITSYLTPQLPLPHMPTPDTTPTIKSYFLHLFWEIS